MTSTSTTSHASRELAVRPRCSGENLRGREGWREGGRQAGREGGRERGREGGKGREGDRARTQSMNKPEIDEEKN